MDDLRTNQASTHSIIRRQELDQKLNEIKQAELLESQKSTESAELSEALERAQAQLGELQRQRQEEQQLLSTAMAMLEKQACYLSDSSLREENAALALDRLRLLEAEINYYLRHSKPLASLDPQKINRLIQLAKQPNPVVG
jgi:hypothetical protein